MTDGFEPRDVKVTARLVAQGAMLEELRALLPALRPESAREDAREAIVQENVLRRPSLASRDKVFSKLSLRYFRPDAPKATACFVRALQATEDPLQTGLLAYTMLLWNDALVFLLGCEWLAPRLVGGLFVAATEDIERELDLLSLDTPAIANWGAASRRKIAGNYLTLLRDCGYASGTARKALRRAYIPPAVILFTVQLLLGGGVRPGRVPESPLFVAMGLSLDDVIAGLTELRRQGHIEFAVQGDTVHLALPKQRSRA